MMRSLRAFEYLEAETVGEAVKILSTYGTKAKVLAGGVDLVDRMRRRVTEPECVVSIREISGLDYIKGDRKQGLRIGALTTLRSVELSPVIRRDYELLWEAVHQIASVQVKNMGTVVGNLCIATPASDVSPPLLALGAELKIASLSHERIILIENFFIGVNQTILQPDEIVTEILLPSLPTGTGGAFVKIVRTAADIAKVNVAVVLTVSDNTCNEVKIALGSVAPTVMRARMAERILKGQKIEANIIAKVAEVAAEEIKPIDDVRSTAEYRKEVTNVLVRRAIEKGRERTKVRDKRG